MKLVALSKSGKGFSLDAYAIVSFSPNAVVDGNIQDVSEVGSAIEKAVKVAGGKLSSAVTAVPASAVITKNIEMSNAFTEFELEDQIKVEADQFIPYPIDEVALDFEVQGTSKSNVSLNNVLLVACRKTDVEQREDAVSAAGLESAIVDVDTYAVERAMNIVAGDEVDSGKLIGIVDIGRLQLSL
ncbi:MAG: type IV pilus assembly protein PilM [Neptuniibacter sp.]